MVEDVDVRNNIECDIVSRVRSRRRATTEQTAASLFDEPIETEVIGNKPTRQTMRRIELIATVTEDGMLTIPVPLDVAPGPHTVIVEIDERTISEDQHDGSDWLTFVQETTGAWHGDFERPSQGDYEHRAAF